MKDLIILGAGGTAFELIEIAIAMNKVKPEWNILGFLDDNIELHKKIIYGFPVLGSLPDSINYPDAYFSSSIGNAYDPKLRKRVREKITFGNDRFAKLIHPTAVICETAVIEPGVILYPNVCISANTYVGHDVFMGHNCVIGHESTVGNHTIMSVAVSIPSDVHIGDCCYLAVGCAFRHQINVGENCLIGVGTKVVKDLPPNSKLINKIENIVTQLY